MAATTWCVVYNGGESAQVIDDEGKTVYPREFACARRSTVRDLVSEGYLMLIDLDNITADSTPAARMAKQEAETKNKQIDADKAEEETLPEEAPKKATASKTPSKANNQ